MTFAGYALGLVLDACLRHQVTTNHKDLIHVGLSCSSGVSCAYTGRQVTAHFLQTTAIAPFEVHIRILKTGRGYSNLLADLVQDVSLPLSCHIFCSLIRTPETYPDYHSLYVWRPRSANTGLPKSTSHACTTFYLRTPTASIPTSRHYPHVGTSDKRPLHLQGHRLLGRGQADPC